jgi:hypothetical protein
MHIHYVYYFPRILGMIQKRDTFIQLRFYLSGCPMSGMRRDHSMYGTQTDNLQRRRDLQNTTIRNQNSRQTL